MSNREQIDLIIANLHERYGITAEQIQQNPLGWSLVELEYLIQNPDRLGSLELRTLNQHLAEHTQREQELKELLTQEYDLRVVLRQEYEETVGVKMRELEQEKEETDSKIEACQREMKLWQDGLDQMLIKNPFEKPSESASTNLQVDPDTAKRKLADLRLRFQSLSRNRENVIRFIEKETESSEYQSLIQRYHDSEDRTRQLTQELEELADPTPLMEAKAKIAAELTVELEKTIAQIVGLLHQLGNWETSPLLLPLLEEVTVGEPAEGEDVREYAHQVLKHNIAAFLRGGVEPTLEVQTTLLTQVEPTDIDADEDEDESDEEMPETRERYILSDESLQRLRDHLDHVMSAEAWHNPNLESAITQILGLPSMFVPPAVLGDTGLNDLITELREKYGVKKYMVQAEVVAAFTLHDIKSLFLARRRSTKNLGSLENIISLLMYGRASKSDETRFPELAEEVMKLGTEYDQMLLSDILNHWMNPEVEQSDEDKEEGNDEEDVVTHFEEANTETYVESLLKSATGFREYLEENRIEPISLDQENANFWLAMFYQRQTDQGQETTVVYERVPETNGHFPERISTKEFNAIYQAAHASLKKHLQRLEGVDPEKDFRHVEVSSYETNILHNGNVRIERDKIEELGINTGSEEKAGYIDLLLIEVYFYYERKGWPGVKNRRKIIEALRTHFESMQ